MMTAHDPAPRFGLYLHIPFCVRKCLYCDFLSEPVAQFSPAARGEFLALLGQEAALALREHSSKLADRPVSTIYFGGGTPSLLHPDEIDTLLCQIEEAFHCRRSDCEEITLECNPVASEMERMRGFFDAGVNRVSLGVQSFDDATLERLGRSHSAAEALGACGRLAGLGLRSWSLDLIFGAPYSDATESDASQKDRERFRRDLEQALALAPPHLSVYGLTVHEGTPLFDRVASGSVCLPDEETQREQFLMARRMLIKAGYTHYEISNYARPGHESRHNALYWTGGEYLGIGPGAHSFFGGKRRANPASIAQWLERLRAQEWPAIAEEPPDPTALRGERVMLALRRLEGVSVETLDQLVEGDFSVLYAEPLDDLKRRGLIEWDGHWLRLSEEGLLLSDTVFERFF